MVPVRRSRALTFSDLDVRGDLPTEFRLLRAGVNSSTQGPVLFDDIAAESVMRLFSEHGVDLAIDLQHDSVDSAACAARSDAADARGWCALALRPAETPVAYAASDLWCVAVTWTPDGERRLKERTQRYISPVLFFDDSEQHRVQEIFNIALVSQPALNRAPSLVASRMWKGSYKMDPKLIQAVIEAIKSGDGDAALELLSQMLIAAVGGEVVEEPAAVEAADEPADPKPEDEAAAMSAALASTLKVAHATPRNILAEVKRMRAELDALTLSRKADELNERIALVGQLVTLGAELPSTAWTDPDTREPSSLLASMPIAALRARVTAFASVPRQSPVRPPRTPDGDSASLSESDRVRAAKISDLGARERFVAARLAHGSKLS